MDSLFSRGSDERTGSRNFGSCRNKDALLAAVRAGADAVYVGGSRFGARAYAANFTEEELLFALDYVHMKERKLYLTVNTLVKESEI